MTDFDVIQTGSQGNAVIIGGVILTDCGVSYRALGDWAEKIKLVLLTHIHSDHFCASTIRTLAALRPTLRFAGGEFLRPALLAAGVDGRNIDILKYGKMYDYRDFKIAPVKLYHDVENYGYRIFINGEKIFYATDTATLAGIEAKNYDLYMVEANYGEEEIKERIAQKEARGEYAYERYALQRHLSREACDRFIRDNISENGRYVYLHEHRE